jgi:NitT/TauT family transport system permease protein
MAVELVDPPTRTDESLAAELAGLDALERADVPVAGRARRAWSATWPKLAAIALGLALWQAVVLSQWRPRWALPGPADVLPKLGELITEADFWAAVGLTSWRAGSGFALAVVIGSVLGIAVARWRLLRSAVGSLITGLQTMPSITWFPLAILLFKLSEGAILFVVLLGAVPSIANGLVAGVDQVPPLYVRAGRVLGARGLGLYRRVVLPAALPAYVSGMKQGWAFAWRSLLAGELLVIIPGTTSIGTRLQFAREFSDTPLLIAYMLVLLAIGLFVDAVFNAADRALRRRHGLLGTS